MLLLVPGPCSGQEAARERARTAPSAQFLTELPNGQTVPGVTSAAHPLRRTTDPRSANLGRVLDTLRLQGPLPRTDIVHRVGLSRATVSSLLGELLERQLVQETPDARRPESGGRPPAVVELEPSAGAAVGVDVGRTHVRAVITDLALNVLAEAHERVDVPDHPQETLQLVVDTTDRLLAEAGVDRAALLGVGLGLPGPVDRASGRVGSATILPAWVGLAPRAELERRLGAPVLVEYDANLGALAEALLGAGRGSGVDDLKGPLEGAVVVAGHLRDDEGRVGRTDRHPADDDLAAAHAAEPTCAGLTCAGPWYAGLRYAGLRYAGLRYDGACGLPRAARCRRPPPARHRGPRSAGRSR